MARLFGFLQVAPGVEVATRSLLRAPVVAICQIVVSMLFDRDDGLDGLVVIALRRYRTAR